MSFERAIRAAKAASIRRHLRTIVRKSMNVTTSGMLKEGMSEPSVFERFPRTKEPLETGILVNSIAVMIDLSPFSQAVAESDASDIHDLLSGYYDAIVPRIEDNGGVVEKYIGDAVVALFGAPFGTDQTDAKHLEAAFRAARQSIAAVAELYAGELLAKAAISSGEMFLGYVGPATHSELTAVGNPLTMLYRLEDLAEPNEVLLPADLYDEMSTKDASPQSAPRLPGSTWQPVRESVPLRGVGNVQIVRCRVAV